MPFGIAEIKLFIKVSDHFLQFWNRQWRGDTRNIGRPGLVGWNRNQYQDQMDATSPRDLHLNYEAACWHKHSYLAVVRRDHEADYVQHSNTFVKGDCWDFVKLNWNVYNLFWWAYFENCPCAGDIFLWFVWPIRYSSWYLEIFVV